MKKLTPLVRLTQHRIQLQKKELALLEERLIFAKRKFVLLQQQPEKELHILRKLPMCYESGPYMKKLEETLNTLQSQIDSLQRQHTHHLNKLHENFAELKRYEIQIEKHKKLDHQESLHQAQTSLDQGILARYVRVD